MPETSDPPLVDLKVTNPVTYFKKWWAKIIGNEGVDFRLHFQPLTATVIALVIITVGFGLGRQATPTPTTLPSPTPTPTPEPILKDTAFTGTLQYSSATAKFYLVTTSAEAITLTVPDNLDLQDLVGKRILAVGQYNKPARILEIADAKDMEILPKKPVPIPTTTPNPTDLPLPEASPKNP